MKRLLEKASAAIVSTGVNLLHNRDTPQFSREELRYLRLSFSAFGEDIGLARWFSEDFPTVGGVYVDVGAYHPIHCSNTLMLNKRGWRGVNIDMNANKIAIFDQLRPADINVHAAVSSTPGTARSLRSGLVETMALDPDGDIPVRRLDDILAATPFRQIDYLNIDCEGHDYEALQSIDLAVYQPKVITIEALGEAEADVLRSYLAARGYTPKERFHYTMLFARVTAQHPDP